MGGKGKGKRKSQPISASQPVDSKLEASDSEVEVDHSTPSDSLNFINNQHILAFIEKLSNNFTMCIHKLLDAHEQRINARLDGMTVDIFDANRKIDILEKSNKDLRAENTKLKEDLKQFDGQLNAIKQQYDDLEQQARASNILIHGLNVNTEQSVCDSVLDFFNSKLSVNATALDIVEVSKFNQSNDSSRNTNSGHPPILVKFSNNSIRRKILSARKALKGQKIVITDHLTTNRNKILRKASECAQASKIKSAWSYDGKIFIKTLNDHIKLIHNLNELDIFYQ